MSDTDNLLAELDAEFGKKPKVKKTGGIPSKQQFQNPTKKLTEFEEANILSRQDAFLSTHQAEAHEIWVKTQSCDCCKAETRYIGGEYIRFRNIRQHSVIRTRIDQWANKFNYAGELPRIIEAHYESVSRCPSCLATESTVDALWDLAQRVARREEDAEPELELVIEGLDTVGGFES